VSQKAPELEGVWIVTQADSGAQQPGQEAEDTGPFRLSYQLRIEEKHEDFLVGEVHQVGRARCFVLCLRARLHSCPWARQCALA